MNRTRLFRLGLLLLAGPLSACSSRGVREPATARPSAADAGYVVTLASVASPLFRVHAELPLEDDTLRLYQAWPCDVDTLCEAGWPLLVRDLRVTDASGRELRTEPLGSSGWVVREPHDGRVRIDYVVDYDLLAANRWPAPREAAFSDGRTLYTVGRPLFVGSAAIDLTHVRFVLPAGLEVAAPWSRDERGDGFVVHGFEALANNGLIIGPRQPGARRTSDFSLVTGLFGRWAGEQEAVERMLAAHVAYFTELLGYEGGGAYLAVFLEDPDLGGEAFEASYALSASPDSATTGWGRLVAHELFHYWNGHRIRGADYVSSQWFQEGVTEYYAILSMARIGLVPEAAALDMLSNRLRGQRDFTGSLAASGARKNRAFYGSATMAAFALDLLIRQATNGRRSLDDLMRRLWRDFGSTDRPYTQADVATLATEMAGTDLGEFFRRFVVGEEPVPIDRLLPTVGLGVSQGMDGAPSITIADASENAGWRALLGSGTR